MQISQGTDLSVRKSPADKHTAKLMFSRPREAKQEEITSPARCVYSRSVFNVLQDRVRGIGFGNVQPREGSEMDWCKIPLLNV